MRRRRSPSLAAVSPLGLERRLENRLVGVAGDRKRARAVILLALVLSLSSADSGAVGGLALPLERSFHLNNAELGLLVTISSLVGAVATLPMGVLVDRANRMRLLTISVALWAAAMVVSALASSYGSLLGARLALGVVVALGGPAVASLTGDLFPSVERSRVLGLILTGELIGAGAGLLLATDVGSLVGWRATFVVLAVPSALLAWALARFPEPARHRSPPIATSSPERIPLRRRVRECEDVEPEADRVNEPVEALSTRHAFAYVLRIRSNLVLIACSTLGYFFLSGLRTFAVVFARGHYGLGAGEVSVLMVVIGGAAAAGTLIGGRVTDRLIGRGHLDARMIVPGVAFVLVVAALVPGILTTSVVVALPLLAVAGSLLGAPNPALDAARLDVTPGLLRGRAEAVRTTFRGLFESFAPLLFGLVADLFGASGDSRAVGSGTSNLALSPASVHGLELTFLVMTIPLALSGVLLLWQRRTYLTDVATADAAEERARATAEGGEGTRPPVPLGRVAERR